LLLLDQMDDLMCLGQVGKAGPLAILADVNVQLTVALDGNGISHDSKLSDGGTNVAVPGNLERLLGKVHDAVDFHGTPTNDQIRLTGNR
jgi:hypothetical protein